MFYKLFLCLVYFRDLYLKLFCGFVPVYNRRSSGMQAVKRWTNMIFRNGRSEKYPSEKLSDPEILSTGAQQQG